MAAGRVLDDGPARAVVLAVATSDLVLRVGRLLCIALHKPVALSSLRGAALS